MNRSLSERASAGFAAAGRFAIRLVREIAPAVLFFFIAFGLLLLLFKLFVSQYSIEFPAFSKAAVGALILGKAIPLLDRAQSRYSFAGYRRAVVVIGKTIIYGLVVIVLGITERVIHIAREAHSLPEAIGFVITNANFDRFLGFVLLISLIVATYLVIQEINRAMGPSALFRLFFGRPVGRREATG